MFVVEILSARISTDRTPLAGGPTATRSHHTWAPSSLRVNATPPPLGRRRLRLMFSKFHLLPRCWSSTIKFPFFRPISLRFCPSSPVRLRLSSQSRPASSPLVASRLPGIAAVVPDTPGGGDVGLIGSVTTGWPDADGSDESGAAPRLEATPV